MPEPTVEQRLFTEPFVFDFFQAVRLMHRLHEDRIGVGGIGPPAREVVRFRSFASLAFPASAIYDLTRAQGEIVVPQMTVTFMGMTGVNGALPRHYTELVMRLERERRGEERRALRDWLDLFNHRFVSLFYRAWEKYRFWTAYGRNQPGADNFDLALRSVAGLATGGLSNRLRIAAIEGGERERPLAHVEDASLVYFAGLLGQRKRNAAGLEALLADYFGVPVRVRQFVGQWLQLEPESQSRLGVEGGNCELSMNAVAGERVHDVQGKIRIRLGPLDYARFNQFLPDRAPVPEHKTFFLLVHLARLYVGADLDFDVQVVLRADAVPECQLTDDFPGPRLGWNTWLTSQQPEHDAGDVIYATEEIVRVDETPLLRI